MQEFKKADQSLFTVGVDLANFYDTQNHAAFIDAVNSIDDEITCEYVGRHSLGPEHLIHFVLSHPEISLALSVVGTWILREYKK